MQRVTNCILVVEDRILLIKKPKRGWYAIPGGKMERGETVKEAVVREFWEETGLRIETCALKGVFTFVVSDKMQSEQEWMMFTFVSNTYNGVLAEHCNEGELEWVPVDAIKTLPMAEGDRKIFEHVLTTDTMLFGSFYYTVDYELQGMRLDPSRQ
ncbi:MAG TPA: 8-oxo-dGTP diphosphatase [Bacillota bacterium]|nr:8-oxo-dGTP diphosphatase [Bacillota bacterium]